MTWTAMSGLCFRFRVLLTVGMSDFGWSQPFISYHLAWTQKPVPLKLLTMAIDAWAAGYNLYEMPMTHPGQSLTFSHTTSSRSWSFEVKNLHGNNSSVIFESAFVDCPEATCICQADWLLKIHWCHLLAHDKKPFHIVSPLLVVGMWSSAFV